MYKSHIPFIENMLTKDERVLASADIHWGVYWQPVTVLAFALLVAFFAWQIGMIFLVFGILLLVRAALHKSFFLIVITNKRLIARYGILQMDVVEMRFRHIESLELERMPTGLVMGYSTVQISGTGQRIIRIPYVSNGTDLRRAYNEIVLEREEKEEV